MSDVRTIFLFTHQDHPHSLIRQVTPALLAQAGLHLEVCDPDTLGAPIFAVAPQLMVIDCHLLTEEQRERVVGLPYQVNTLGRIFLHEWQYMFSYQEQLARNGFRNGAPGLEMFNPLFSVPNRLAYSLAATPWYLPYAIGHMLDTSREFGEVDVNTCVNYESDRPGVVEMVYRYGNRRKVSVLKDNGHDYLTLDGATLNLEAHHFALALENIRYGKPEPRTSYELTQALGLWRRLTH